MKVIRWILSNIILIAFVLALTYAYVYWDNLTGEDTPAGKAIAYLSVEYDEIREFLDSYDFDSGGVNEMAQTEPVAPVAQTASVPQMMPPPEQRPSEAVQPQAAPSQARLPQAPVQSARPPSAVAPSQRPPAEAPRYPVATAPIRQAPPAGQPARPPVPPTAMVQQPRAMQPVAPRPQPAPAPADSAAAEDEAKPSVRELWISAREEYHRGNVDQSISNYRQVIAQSEGNHDAYGELGNVFLSRGKYREAANAYYQAAAILIKKGQSGRARSLLPMLERLDRAKAEELNQMLSAPRS